MFFSTVSSAQQGTCFPTCRQGYVCSPSNECVSLCNPPCSDTEICTAEARCVGDPSAQQAPAAYPQPAGYPQPAQPPAQGAPQGIQPPEPDYEVISSGLAEPGSFRLNVNFALGFGSEVTIENDAIEAEQDLNATFGASVQGLFTVGSYFLVGPTLAFRSYEVDTAPDRSNVFNAGLALGGHYAIDLGSVAIDPFLVATIGLGVLLSDDVVVTETALGVSFGLRAGAQIWFTPMFGATFALGYERIDLFSDDTAIGEDATLSAGQFAMDLGVAIRLGS